jgi:hypothetical protein
MKSLRQNEKELVFDYFLGQATSQAQQEASELIRTDGRASQFYEMLSGNLDALESYDVEACPDHLAQKTLERLTLASRASQKRLERLLDEEARKPVTARRSFWANFSELGAVAAMILIVAGVAFPTLTNARYKYWQSKCSAQLASVAQGISQYSADHANALPAVATSEGMPWWKVGDQGQQNVSNTRHLWVLVKGNYVQPEDFVCPARIQGKVVKLDSTQVPGLADFPSRKYVTYSFRVMGNQPQFIPHGRQVLISDLNPIFERLPEPVVRELDINIDDSLLRANSINHRGRGQNVLCSDNSVAFSTTRTVGNSNDDIFTIQNTKQYKGSEVPASADDAFLAP